MARARIIIARSVVIAAAIAACAACGARTGQGAGGEAASPRDSGARDVAIRADASTGSFCGGSAARAELEGIERSVTLVQGDIVAMGCCDGVAARFQIDVGGETHTLVASFAKFGGSPTGLPRMLDLAHLPDGWWARVDYARSVCPPPGCAAAGSLATQEADPFEGSASIVGSTFAHAQVSLCLTARAGPSDVPRVLRSVRLHANNVPVLPIP